jgi:hypothetical protein
MGKVLQIVCVVTILMTATVNMSDAQGEAILIYTVIAGNPNRQLNNY